MNAHNTCDVVVVGGGPVGENVAARAVRGGLSAVLVEAELFGGECSYWACMPSKALLRPGQALAAAQRVPGAAQAVSGDLDVAAVLAWRDGIASHWHDDSQVAWAQGAGIEVVRGRGQLAGERLVEVTAKDGSVSQVQARVAVVVCTGSVPTSPALEGLAEAAAWGSREATSSPTVPGRLAVIGGGVVGCELAQAYARLGSEVTLLALDRLLGRMEDRAGELVTEGLEADGVTIRFGRKAVEVVRPDPRGPLTLKLDDGSTLQADELLVATGRRPATDDLGLGEVGLPEGKPLTVDASGRVEGVQGGWLWAAGDVTSAAPLTHMGKYAARAVGDAIAASQRAGAESGEPDDWSPLATTALQRAVTQVVFTDPEVASVGPTAAQARDSGRSVRCVDLDLAVAGTSLHAQDYAGWARLVVDDENGTLLGATFVGQDVAELLHAATVAVVGEVPLHRLWHAVPAYPTISEVWLRLLEADGF